MSQSSSSSVPIHYNSNNNNNNNNNNNDHNNNNPYVFWSPVHVSSSADNSQSVKVFGALSRCGKRFEEASRKIEVISDNIWNHLKISPRVSDAAIARVAQGTKVMIEGGYEKVFQHTFDKLNGEKLLKSYACYLLASSGPLIGTLYISNKRIAFSSDFPLTHYSSPPTNSNPHCLYYKVVIRNEQLSTINPSANIRKHSEKYIHVVTRDGQEFWFMGFISYDKALKNILEALHSSSL